MELPPADADRAALCEAVFDCDLKLILALSALLGNITGPAHTIDKQFTVTSVA